MSSGGRYVVFAVSSSFPNKVLHHSFILGPTDLKFSMHVIWFNMPIYSSYLGIVRCFYGVSVQTTQKRIFWAAAPDNFNLLKRNTAARYLSTSPIQWTRKCDLNHCYYYNRGQRSLIIIIKKVINWPYFCRVHDICHEMYFWYAPLYVHIKFMIW